MRWIINISTSYLRYIVMMVVLFFLTPFIVAKIGIDAFGLWSLIFSVVALFGLMDLGFATAANKYMGEFHGSGDHTGRNQVLATLLVVYVALGVLCVLVVALVSWRAGVWFDLAPEMQHWFQLALWLLGGAVAINLPLNLFKAVLNGSGRMVVVNGIDLGMQLLNAALVVTLLNADYGIRALIFSTTLTMVLGPLLAALLAFRLTPALSVSPRLFSAGRVREMLGFSFYFFIANVAVLIILRIDLLVINAFLPLSAVAVYAIGLKISEYVYYLNKQFSNALMPLVAQSRGGGDDAMIEKILFDGTRLHLAIAVPLIVLLAFYAKDVILLWMGPDFAGAAPVLQLLLGSVFCTAIYLNAANVLAMTGQHRIVAIAMAVSAVINLLLSVVLIQLLGINGVALATFIATFLVEILFLVSLAVWSRKLAEQTVSKRFWRFLLEVLSGIGLRKLWRRLRRKARTWPPGVELFWSRFEKLGEFYAEVLWRTLPPVGPALAVAWGLGQLQPSADGFLWVFLEGGAAALAYYATFYAWGLKPVERAFLATKLTRG